MAVTAPPSVRSGRRHVQRGGSVKAHHFILGLLALVSCLLVISYLHAASLEHPHHDLSAPGNGVVVVPSPRAAAAAAAAAALTSAKDAADRSPGIQAHLRRAQSIAHKHEEEHQQADAHIVEHWKDRGAQLAPKQHEDLPVNDTTTNNGGGSTNDLDSKKFILFHGIASGQGAGNIISGLLAAHLYGDEFGRIVCLTTGMRSFLEAYQPIHPDTVTYCPLLKRRGLPNTNFGKNTFQVLTYEAPPNECRLKEMLQSTEQVLYMGGNTYPRWPIVPKDYFLRFYRPRTSLQQFLPPPPQPKTVVHLRMQDGNQDKRKGLDSKSLEALGNFLASNVSDDVPYLVTNRVEWFDYFSTTFGWRHPEWHVVTHSALGGGGRWGRRGAVSDNVDYNSTVQNLQMWSDWNTLLMAEVVYHTHSDFSISAIHWMDTESKTIQGFDPARGELILSDESWRVSWKEEGVTPPLKDRTVDGDGIAKLRCGKFQLNALFGEGTPPDVVM